MADVTEMEDKIEKVVDLAAPISRVWRALTDYKEFGEWFRVDLEGPFKVGEMSRGKMTHPGCENLAWLVLVERMDEERLFSFSWGYDGDADPASDLSDQPTMRVEFRIEPISTGTRLTITESGFLALPDPRRLEKFRQNTHGWNEQAKNIAAHVES